MPTLSLEVSISNLKLTYPTMIASGILAVNVDVIARLARTECLGGIVTKSLTYNPRTGYSNPVVAGEECYLINAMGLPNPGYRAFIEEFKSRFKRGGNVKIVASIAASNPREALEMAGEVEDAKFDGLELNLSCPHAEKLGLEVGRDLRLVSDIVESATSTVNIPVLVKVGVSDVMVDAVKRAVDKGVSGVVAINTVRGLAIDIYAKKPILSNVYGGVSGPAIKPIALAAVYELYREVEVPIIGCGGVDSWRAAVEMFLAGAIAVQVGTAILYKGLGVFREIVEGVSRYLEEEGFKSIMDIVGLAHNR